MNKTPLHYRTAGHDDIPQLVNLGVIAYGVYREAIGDDNNEKMMNNLRNTGNWEELLGKAQGFVCTDGTKIVGMAFITPSGNPWDIFENDWAYIRLVGVDPAYQGQGIARTLTAMCINEAKKNKEKTIALHTSEIMPAARRIYESVGFRILKEIPPRFEKRYWIYTLDVGEEIS